MHLSQVRAWILLAVPDEPEPLYYVLGMADGLNKAIPTLEELRESLGWLQAADLIGVEGDSFRRTDHGRRRIAHCQQPGDNAFDLWDKLAADLEGTRVDAAAPFELTAEDLEDAYGKYREWFRTTYEKLRAEDS